jgi:TetR/AcrR family transcriptional repressor of nem operon
MARTRQFDERQALIAATLQFWEKGYEGTSMQDLEEAMGLTRTSIYNAFGNKRRLFERVLSCYQESVLAALFVAMDSAANIRDGVRRLLDAALGIHFDKDNPGGCLVVLSVLESEQHDEHSRAMLEQTMQELKRMLHTRLVSARKAGELPAELDVAGTATTIAATMAGLMVLGKAGYPKSTLRKTIAQVVRLLDP